MLNQLNAVVELQQALNYISIANNIALNYLLDKEGRRLSNEPFDPIYAKEQDERVFNALLISWKITIEYIKKACNIEYAHLRYPTNGASSTIQILIDFRNNIEMKYPSASNFLEHLVKLSINNELQLHLQNILTQPNCELKTPIPPNTAYSNLIQQPFPLMQNMNNPRANDYLSIIKCAVEELELLSTSFDQNMNQQSEVYLAIQNYLEIIGHATKDMLIFPKGHALEKENTFHPVQYALHNAQFNMGNDVYNLHEVLLMIQSERVNAVHGGLLFSPIFINNILPLIPHLKIALNGLFHLQSPSPISQRQVDLNQAITMNWHQATTAVCILNPTLQGKMWPTSSPLGQSQMIELGYQSLLPGQKDWVLTK